MTHLDKIKKTRQVRQLKKRMKERFWTEVCDGAKLFYISGTRGQLYTPRETLNLSRYITIIKPRPLTWRASHPGVLVDRFEDITDPELIRQDEYCNRHVCLYGFVRGTFLRSGMPVHIPGCGDFQMKDITSLDDPLPMDDKQKGKLKSDKRRGVYGPMSNMGDLFYDKDSVYIEVDERDSDDDDDGEVGDVHGEKSIQKMQQKKLVQSIIRKADSALDEKLQGQSVKLFAKASKPIELKEENDDDDDDEENFKEEDDDNDGEDDDMSDDDDNDDGVKVEEEDPNRVRRRANFANDAESKDVKSEKVQYDEDEDDDDENGDGNDDDVFDPVFRPGKSGMFEENENEDELSDLEDADGMGEAALKWKEKMAEHASNAFYSADVSVQNLVYGDSLEMKKKKPTNTSKIFKRSIDGDDDGSEENLFDLVKNISQNRGRKTEESEEEVEDIDEEDRTYAQIEPDDLDYDWDDAEVRETIRNKFVTGDWSTRRDAASHGAAKPKQKSEDAMSDDDESENEDENGVEVDYGSEDDDDEESLERKRQEKKKQFDQTFDKLKEKGGDDDEDDDDVDETGLLTVERWRRKQLEDDPQTILNKTEFEGMNKQLREQIEGFSPGTYVRIEIADFPPEFVQSVDFKNPILVGGMHQEECRMGFIKLRMKRHRWFPKTLKNKDPLIFSIGWRRFQSIPTYCVQDVNGRHRSIKYTPDHMHCIAAIYGPYTPQNTGMIAFQTLSNKVDTFRVAATGYVMEIDQNFQIVKKLKLIGYPKKVHKNTAFITKMFTSALEIAKYEGAALRTVSGIRGQVKKALKNGDDGDFRATFEDKILMSDIVFLRTWYQLELDKFYNPVLNHLTRKWYAMRTVYQLRKLRGESIPINKDSQYRPIEARSTVGHDQTFIPKPNLLKKLPFAAQHKKVVESTGLTDDFKKHLGTKAPIHGLTTALMSDKEVARANMLRKMQAIDADRRKKQQKLDTKLQLKVKKHEVKEERLRNQKKNATKKRKYIEQEMRRIKKAKYIVDDNSK